MGVRRSSVDRKFLFRKRPCLYFRNKAMVPSVQSFAMMWFEAVPSLLVVMLGLWVLQKSVCLSRFLDTWLWRQTGPQRKLFLKQTVEVSKVHIGQSLWFAIVYPDSLANHLLAKDSGGWESVCNKSVTPVHKPSWFAKLAEDRPSFQNLRQ